jgi:hypothetical protein
VEHWLLTGTDVFTDARVAAGKEIIMPYATDNWQDAKVRWHHPFPDLQCHHGIHPTQIPFGAFSLALGVDGQVDGVLRRWKGLRLWTDFSTYDLTATPEYNYYDDFPG